MPARMNYDWLVQAESEGEDAHELDALADFGRGEVIDRRNAKRRRDDLSSDDSSGDDSPWRHEHVRSSTAEESRLTRGQNLRGNVAISDETVEVSDGRGVNPDFPSLRDGETLATDDEEGDNSSNLHKLLARSAKTARKSGVVYISRIPPFMKPHTVKHLLSPHAPSGLGRIFLTPENSEVRQTRLRAGGNKKHNFVDGWVEFASKREAKSTVEALNTRIIGGKKGGYYYDDVWNLKYLYGFKWRHLTEQIANENAERAARMRVEDRRERKEQKDFLANVERAKMLEGMAKKRAAKLRDSTAAEEGFAEVDLPQKKINADLRLDTRRPQREFAQRAVKSRASYEQGTAQSGDVQRVLNKIF